VHATHLAELSKSGPDQRGSLVAAVGDHFGECEDRVSRVAYRYYGWNVSYTGNSSTSGGPCIVRPAAAIAS
jgi:hypothetical protein